jgi:formamidopyrimidine-DNA glycosylase
MTTPHRIHKHKRPDRSTPIERPVICDEPDTCPECGTELMRTKTPHGVAVWCPVCEVVEVPR